MRASLGVLSLHSWMLCPETSCWNIESCLSSKIGSSPTSNWQHWLPSTSTSFIFLSNFASRSLFLMLSRITNFENPFLFHLVVDVCWQKVLELHSNPCLFPHQTNLNQDRTEKIHFTSIFSRSLEIRDQPLVESPLVSPRITKIVECTGRNPPADIPYLIGRYVYIWCNI